MYLRFGLLLFVGALFISCKTTEGENTSGVKDLADGTNWCHLRLESTNGTKVSIDYTVYSDLQAGKHDADPVWVNMQGGGLNGSEDVEAVLIEKIIKNNQEQEGNIAKLKLVFVPAQNKFTAQLPSSFALVSSTEKIVGQEFAFRVNQDWLKDPVSQNSNFKGNLYDIHKMNHFKCLNASSPTPQSLPVKDWRALPDQTELDSLTSHPINDPAFPFTDYRPDAPGAGMDLPGQALLDAMRKNAAQFGTGSTSNSTMRSCLQTGYSPTHWPDIALHFYCLMNEPRYCYTYGTSGGLSRFDTFKGWVGQWNGSGSYPYQSYVPAFQYVKDNVSREFQYVMFAQTNAFKPEQEQAVINAFWGVQNPWDPNECNAKRPRRSEDPTDGSHCRPDKQFRIKLIGRSR